MDFIKGWIQLAIAVCKWKLSWIPNMLGIKCGKCDWAEDGVCQYAGEISTDYWCIHFRRTR